MLPARTDDSPKCYNEATLSDPIIEDIKQRLDITDVIGNYLTLRKAGVNYKALCPFHGEKSPSFMVNRERQIYRCFGCGEAGDIFAFIMKYENVDFPHALELLAARAGVALPDRSPSTSGRGTDKSRLTKLNALAARLFYQILSLHTAGREAQDYLSSRKMSKVTIDAFGVGFAPPKRDTLQTALRNAGFSSDETRLAGNPDRFVDRIVFPLRDVIGNVVGFSGRALHDQTPKYLNTPETVLFHKNRYLYGLNEAKKNIAQHQQIILMEGQMDVTLSHQAGITWAVGTSGTALSEDHLTILRRYSDRLLLAFDGDAAGQKATLRAIQLSLKYNFDLGVVVIPPDLDPGAMIARDVDSWRQAVSRPKPAIDWLLTYYFSAAIDRPSVGERQAMYEAIFPYIAALTDAVSQDYALQRFALLLGVTREDVIRAAFADWRAKIAKKPPPRDAKTPPSSQDILPLDDYSRQEWNLLGFILLDPSLLAHADLRLVSQDFSRPAHAKLYTILLTWYNENATQSSKQLISRLEATLKPAERQAMQKLVFDTQTYCADFSQAQRYEEYAVVVKLVRQRLREARIRGFAARIATAEANNDRPGVAALMKEMHQAITTKEINAQKDS